MRPTASWDCANNPDDKSVHWCPQGTVAKFKQRMKLAPSGIKGYLWFSTPPEPLSKP